MLRHLEDMLQAMDYQVMTAAGVDEGLRLVQAWSPDVTVVDILMPDRDGLNFIMEAQRLAPDMRIVAITGGGRIGARTVLNMAAGLGAHATLAKPFSADELATAIARLKPAD
jgi:DNA-binding NtrC family response regulator